MSGNQQASYSLVSIAFSEYFHNSNYSNDHHFEVYQIEWSFQYNFRLKSFEGEWEELEVSIGITLLNALDGEKIVELDTKSTYRVTAKLPYDFKYIIICRLINETIGHAQGAMCVQSPNVDLSNILPQAFNHAEDNEIELKKSLFEKWY